MLTEQEIRISQARRAKRLRRVALSAVVLVIVIGGSWGLWKISRRLSSPPPGGVYPSVGQEHIALDAAPPRPYNSNPPSSGGHYPQPANWGIYDYEVNDKIFIHNLEHGGIWISYRPTVPSAVIDQLKAIVNEFSGVKIVMAPRSANDTDIAVAAWSHVYKFNLTGNALTPQQIDDIRRFYKALRDRGPEFVPGNMPGIDPRSVQSQ